MAKTILVLTSTNLACNPRCLKEVRLLRERGDQVTLVAFNLHNWTTEKEVQLQAELKGIRFHYLEAGRHPFLPWLVASLLERACRRLLSFAPSNTRLAAIAIEKRSWMLLRWVKKNKQHYDGVIAHNPPAFYAAAWIGNATSSPFAIDVEDYHPGEGKDPIKQRCAALLMQSILGKAAYVSYASPLIMEYSRNLVGPAEKDKGIVVNNSFSRTEFLRPGSDDPDEYLRIVWFSQFIDYGRGLEMILPVLDEFRSRIRLTLIGAAREGFVAKELAGREYIHCIDSLSQEELHHELSRHDLGLALEDGKADLNRNLCLTNKIWSYLLAGLYIVASDTSAQQRFMEDYPGHGVCTSLGTATLSKVLGDLVGDCKGIRARSAARYERAGAAAWENESAVLTDQWKKWFNA